MNRSPMGTIIGIALFVLLVFPFHAGSGEQTAADGIPPQVVADYIHAIIQADRTLYTTHVVERMEAHQVVTSQEYWKQTKSLPLPAQMLLLSGLNVEQQGLGLQFRLASLNPIYEKNGPTTDFEKAGLAAVLEDPSRPYSRIIQRGTQKFFKAIYADHAVSVSCINCHNGHVLSYKRDYKLGDVMGGIVISFPIQ